MAIFSPLIARLLPWVPRFLIRPVALRYIAGETRDELLAAARSIHAAGLLSTADVLGENVTTEEEAEAATQEYDQLIAGLSGAGLPSQISVKPTMLGLRLGEDLAAEHLERLAQESERRGISLAVDMEDSSTTDATLRLYRRLRERHENVGVALQAYLRRSVGDVRDLLSLAPTVRVCKGIYVEPESIALRDPQAIRDSYLEMVTLLLDGGVYPAIATHDPWLVEKCLDLLDRRGGGPASHEFQMLLGVGDALRGALRDRGSPLRLYCPYGSDWYGYSLRRLKENPQLVTHVVKSVLRLEPLRYRRRW